MKCERGLERLRALSFIYKFVPTVAHLNILESVAIISKETEIICTVTAYKN